MTTHPHLRTAERLKQSDFNASGFTARKNRPARVIQSIVIGLLIGAVCSVGVVYYDVLMSFYAIMGVLFVIVIFQIYMERIKLLQQSAEFMNALFSSAVSDGFRFCGVMRNDGDFLYVNNGFQKLFPKFVTQPELSLNKWAGLQGMSAAHQQQLNALASSGANGRVAIIMNAGEADQQEPFSIMITPIPSPKGYLLVRGD